MLKDNMEKFKAALAEDLGKLVLSERICETVH
jgi:hypothetical protein